MIRPSTSSSIGPSFAGRSIATASVSGSRSIMSGGISNRPMTGAGGMARTTRNNPTNVVHNTAFYINLLQTKTTQIVEEMDRLRYEIGDEDVRRAWEQKLELKTKEVQEMKQQLSDYNMAKDMERSGVSHQDIQRQTSVLQDRNKLLENEVDNIFLARKKTEDEVSRLRLKMKNENQDFEVQKLIGEIEILHEETMVEEEKIAQLSEARSVGGTHFFFSQEEEKRVGDLKRSIAQMEERIQLVGLNDIDAKQYLLGKKNQERELNKKLTALQNEVEHLASEHLRLRSRVRAMNGGAAAYHVDKMEEIDTFLSNVPDLKEDLENKRLALMSEIESLQHEIREAEKFSACPTPSKNEVELAKEEVAFTTSQLEVNQDTVKRLEQQKLARIDELECVQHLQEKMEAEMEELARRSKQMMSEMEQHDIDALKADSAAQREALAERCVTFEERLNHLDEMMKKLQVKYDEQMSSCGDDNWPTFNENNMRLQQALSAVHDLHNKMSGDNSYRDTKAECLELLQSLNTMILRRNEQV